MLGQRYHPTLEGSYRSRTAELYSASALANGRIMVSTGGAIIEGTSTPTFTSETLTATTNQLFCGVPNSIQRASNKVIDLSTAGTGYFLVNYRQSRVRSNYLS